ncbi:restriction endonuclease subunit S [Olsenella sp. An270]|uniref:restriction endonuclease subunit S n=1 Tax=Olsenella sp. An270 TaxID=1965615 RepID=UPI001180EAED|nr:restriction endonuclease subunit S [Olsenella sp. An270]
MRRVRLGELISKAKVERCGDRDFPVLSMTMHDGIVRQTDRFKKAIASKDVSLYKVVRPNQLVVGFPIDEGVIYVQGYDCPGIMSPAYNVWDIDSDRIVPAYLELALHSPRSMAYYAERMRGTTARRRSITSENLTAMQVPLPSLDEQLNVISTLGSVEKLASDCSRTLSLLDDLVKSRFVEMFGDPCDPLTRYPKAKIGELARVSSGATPSRKHPEYYEGTIPWVKTGEVASGNIIETEEHITEEALQETSCRILGVGTVLVAMYGQGDTRGRAALLTIEAATNQACAALEFGNQIDSQFALAYLQHSYQDLRELSYGGNQKNLSLRVLKEYPMMVPPLSLQKEFAAFAAEVAKSQFVGRAVRDVLYCYVRETSSTAEREDLRASLQTD